MAVENGGQELGDLLYFAISWLFYGYFLAISWLFLWLFLGYFITIS